jgi:hypothetical protein
VALDADDRPRLDYEQTTQYLRALIDVRFRLLAFVPTVTGVAVATIGQPRPAAELLGVGALFEVERFHRRAGWLAEPTT